MTVDGMSDAAKAGEAEPVAETVAWMNKNGYVVSAWWRTSEPDKYADYTTRLVKAPAPAPASPEGKRFNEATLMQIAAVRPDLIPEICASAPAYPDFEGIPPSAAQQAERIATIKAQLAEAVGLLEEALPSIKTIAYSFENTQDKWHTAFIHRIKSVIENAREVIG